MSFSATPYHQLAFKASHNSYQTGYSMQELLSWRPKHPSEFGCRGLEIDFARHSDASGGRSEMFFQVTHDQGGDGLPLAHYLRQMLDWHVENRDHDPVFVSLCIKSEDGPVKVFPDEMDLYLRTWFDASAIYPPSQMITQNLDLVGYVRENGWPKMKDLAGCFLMCLSGTEKWKSLYADTLPAERLCFADQDFADNQAHPKIPLAGNRAVANIHVFTEDFHALRQAASKFRRANFLIRGYQVNSGELWEKVRTAKLNAIATDRVAGHAWAAVGDQPFAPV